MEWSDMQINYPISKFINIDENYKKAKLIKAEFCPKLAFACYNIFSDTRQVLSS